MLTTLPKRRTVHLSNRLVNYYIKKRETKSRRFRWINLPIKQRYYFIHTPVKRIFVATNTKLASASVILFRYSLSFISQENVGVQVDDVAKTKMRNSLVITANLIPKGYLSMSKSYCFVLLFVSM